MQCDIFAGEEKIGVLQSERQGLYTRFCGILKSVGVTRLYGVFEQGECALGIPVPEQGKLVLRTSVPTARLPGGQLLRGQVDWEEQGQSHWEYFPGGVIRGIRYPAGQMQGSRLRFLWHHGEPFPNEEVLLFYALVSENGRTYLEIGTEKLGEPGEKKI